MCVQVGRFGKHRRVSRSARAAVHGFDRPVAPDVCDESHGHGCDDGGGLGETGFLTELSVLAGKEGRRSQFPALPVHFDVMQTGLPFSYERSDTLRAG